MMIPYRKCCEKESQMPLKFTGFQEVSLSDIERDQSQHVKLRALVWFISEDRVSLAHMEEPGEC